MRLETLMDMDKLNGLIRDGYINERRHPTLPLRILNYSHNCAFENVWPLEVCICRGLIVDDAGNVVSRPIPKFFNLGQIGCNITRVWDQSGTKLEKETVPFDADFLLQQAQSWNAPLTITRKLDGWAGISWNYEDKWGVASRGSFDSPGALYATEKFQKFVKYTAVDFIPKNTTLFFEIISKVTRIVVPYDFEGLVLITAIDNDTGDELTYEQLQKLYADINQYAKDRPWCRMVEKFDKSLTACVADDDKTEEGYVVSIRRPFLPPLRAKIKLAEYCRLHRIITGVTPQGVWKEIANPMSPWLDNNSKMDRSTGEVVHDLSVPKEFAKWVVGWRDKLYQNFHSLLVKAIEAASHLDDKHGTIQVDEKLRQMEWLRQNYGELATPARLLKSGKVAEAYATLWDVVRPFGREDAFYTEGKGE